jgi:hypothetical protein
VPLEEFVTDAYFAEGELTAEAQSYYAVPVAADTLQAVYLMPHPDVSKPVDLVLRLWSADGTTLLATGAAEWPETDGEFDLDIITRFAEDGFVCGEVFSASEWAGDAPEAGPNSHHGLVIGPADTYFGNDYVVFEEEPNDPTNPQTASLDGFLALPIHGTLASESDADAYAFQATYSRLTVLFMPTRPPTEIEEGWGHDAVLPTVTIVDDNDDVILRRSGAEALETCEAGNFCSIMTTATPGATYRLVVEPPPGPIVPDAFYGVWIWSATPLPGLVVENPDDVTMGTNDGHATAEAIGSGTPTRDAIEYLFEGELPAGDEDWWYLGPGPGDLSGDCRSLTYGSGVTGFTVEALHEATPDGAPALSAAEAPTVPARWGNGTAEPPLPGPGGYFIRITSTSFDPVVQGRRYRCRLTR